LTTDSGFLFGRRTKVYCSTYTLGYLRSFELLIFRINFIVFCWDVFPGCYSFISFYLTVMVSYAALLRFLIYFGLQVGSLFIFLLFILGLSLVGLVCFNWIWGKGFYMFCKTRPIVTSFVLMSYKKINFFRIIWKSFISTKLTGQSSL
jgi:hypothetical protein